MYEFKSFEPLLCPPNDREFNDIALKLFAFQARHNPLYKTYLQHLSLDVASVQSVTQIPFLPISFFKNHDITTGVWLPEAIYRSSGTTATSTSQHLIRDRSFYLHHALRCFESFYGSIKNYHILALLPSYLERTDSSLVAMIDHFIKCSESQFSAFYLHQIDTLLVDLQKARRSGRKVVLWGVTFALLDLAERYKPDLSGCIVFETGGMKGRRKEITRQELHSVLKQAFNVTEIHSEYGMTELLSQAYREGDKPFRCAASLRVLGREINDPFSRGVIGETCALNVIDLANLHTMAFIETEDLGIVYEDGTFEVLGRMDNSDVRGCNLLVG